MCMYVLCFCTYYKSTLEYFVQTEYLSESLASCIDFILTAIQA